MGRSVEVGHSRISIVHLSRETLNALLGPAEAQYAELALVLEGNQGTVACGTTFVAGDANDLDPFEGVAARLVWNPVAGATSYRVQRDFDSSTFVSEDWFQDNYQFTEIMIGSITPGTNATEAVRIIAHVGHAFGHGGTPIAGDVVSNDCAFTLIYPD